MLPDAALLALAGSTLAQGPLWPFLRKHPSYAAARRVGFECAVGAPEPINVLRAANRHRPTAPNPQFGNLTELKPVRTEGRR